MAQSIMVLFGGVSTEYLISLRSAFNIISGLREAGFRVIPVGITPAGDWYRYEGPDEAIPADCWQTYISASSGQAGQTAAIRSPRDFITAIGGCVPDCIFPAVHGINCEDGALQGLLTLSGIPYVGCGVLASAAGMDKLHAKMIFRYARIPQCRFTSATRREIKRNCATVADRVAARVGYPCFLKPSNGGSSVGTCRAADRDELMAALVEVSQYDRTVVIEEFVRAREIEVAVMGNERPRTALIGEVATSDQVAYYDYEAKYFMDDGAEVILPAPLDEKAAARIRRYAIKAYRAMGCAGLARIDFFICRDTGAIYMNEVNTLPGFTPISLFPKAFAVTGVPLPQLVGKLCRLAIQEHAALSRKESV